MTSNRKVPLLSHLPASPTIGSTAKIRRHCPHLGPQTGGPRPFNRRAHSLLPRNLPPSIHLQPRTPYTDLRPSKLSRAAGGFLLPISVSSRILCFLCLPRNPHRRGFFYNGLPCIISLQSRMVKLRSKSQGGFRVVSLIEGICTYAEKADHIRLVAAFLWKAS